MSKPWNYECISLALIAPLSPAGGRHDSQNADCARGSAGETAVMSSSTTVISGVGLAGKRRKSRWPARLDVIQSASGLIIALFMWGHMFFVSSILISNDAMWKITKMFEGYFVFGRAYPVIVSFVVAGVTALIVVHAVLALRKFP